MKRTARAYLMTDEETVAHLHRLRRALGLRSISAVLQAMTDDYAAKTDEELAAIADWLSEESVT